MQGLLKTVSLLLSPGSGLWEEAREGAVDGKKKRSERHPEEPHKQNKSNNPPIFT